MGDLALIGFVLILVILSSILWWIAAIKGVRRVALNRTPIGLRTIPAQLIAVGVAINAVSFGPFFGILTLAFPTIVFANVVWPTSYPSSFIQQVAPVPLGLAALSFALCLPLRPTRAIALLVAFSVATVSALVVGETISRSAMCETARANGLSGIQRNSVLWSLANTARDIQIEVHAVARHQSDRYAWSYSEMDWYPVPEYTFARVDGPILTSCQE